MQSIPEKFNICVIRPPAYIWSSVFKELAEWVCYALEDLGCTVTMTENKIVRSAVNVVIGAHLLGIDMIMALPKDAIILNTEQMGVGSLKWNEKIKLLVSRCQSWDYSLENIEHFGQWGLNKPKFLKLGHHPRLQRIRSDVEKDIDVLFYGGPTPERLAILEGLKKQKLNVVHLCGVFGAERDAYIARSKTVLNLHQHRTKILEVVRIHYLMNNGKAVVSQYDETSKGAEDYQAGLMLVRFEDLVESCRALCASNAMRADLEEKSLSTLQKLDAVDIMRQMFSV